MRKLEPNEIQGGRVFHRRDGGSSVKVSRVVVVFQEIGSRSRGSTLQIDDFCQKYQRKKRKT